jgi:hypothetical protein
MTSFSEQPGTPSTYSMFKEWRRFRRGLDNQDLRQAISNGNAELVKNLLQRADRDLEEPYRIRKSIRMNDTFWRTPLEHAVDRGLSATTVALLLAAGSKITPLTLELAIDGMVHDWSYRRDDREFELAADIGTALSKGGADWLPTLESYRCSDRNRVARFLKASERLKAEQSAMAMNENVPETVSAPRQRPRL